MNNQYRCAFCHQMFAGTPAATRGHQQSPYCADCHQEIIRRAVEGRKKKLALVADKCRWCGKPITEDNLYPSWRHTRRTCIRCSDGLRWLADVQRHSDLLARHVAAKEPRRAAERIAAQAARDAEQRRQTAAEKDAKKSLEEHNRRQQAASILVEAQAAGCQVFRSPTSYEIIIRGPDKETIEIVREMVQPFKDTLMCGMIEFPPDEPKQLSLPPAPAAAPTTTEDRIDRLERLLEKVIMAVHVNTNRPEQHQ